MKKTTKDSIKAGFALIFILVIFIIVSYIIQKNIIDFNFLSPYKPIAILLYLFILVLEAVIAPINTYPLVPVASELFGWIPAAIYTLIGWTLGSFVVFVLAQKYGKPLIKKLVSLEKIEKYEKAIPEKHIFASVILLRILVPLDVVSYALGFFTQMKKSSYTLATFIGYAPLAFIVAYIGTVSIAYQIVGFIILTIGVLIGWFWIFQKNKIK